MRDTDAPTDPSFTLNTATAMCPKRATPLCPLRPSSTGWSKLPTVTPFLSFICDGIMYVTVLRPFIQHTTRMNAFLFEWVDSHFFEDFFKKPLYSQILDFAKNSKTLSKDDSSKLKLLFIQKPARPYSITAVWS